MTVNTDSTSLVFMHPSLTYAIDALQREITFREGIDLGAGLIRTEIDSYQQAIEILKEHDNARPD